MRSSAASVIVGLGVIALGLAMVAYRDRITRYQLGVGRVGPGRTLVTTVTLAVAGLVVAALGVALLVRGVVR